MSGALIPKKFDVPLSFKTSLFANEPVPWTVMLPLAVTVDEVLIEPVVSIDVDPPMSEVPAIVPELITGLVRVLLVNVATSASVTTTPLSGKVAVEVLPIPPLALGRMPDTAAEFSRFIALKVGMPPPLGTVST